MSAKLNLNKPKVLKTALGCLINLSTMNESKEGLGMDPTYYQVIYTVIEEYSNVPLMLDYALRLILNSCDQRVAFQNYLSGRIISKVLRFLD